MRVLHVVAALNRDTGGTARSVPRLADAQQVAGLSVTVASLDYATHGPFLPPGVARHVHFAAGAATRCFRGWHPQLAAELLSRAATVDVIHNHGLWMQPNRYARIAAARSGKPLVISLRGMLESWSMQRSAWRKRLAWLAFERANLSHAALLHATSMMEAHSAREALPDKPIAVVPNGVDFPDSAAETNSTIDARWPVLQHKRVLLFVSRLHPKKGLDLLLRAWRQLASSHPDWYLVIAGPGDDDYRRSLEAMVADAGLHMSVSFVGAVDTTERDALYARAELMVLPTRSENFGNVIAEALAAGCPVVTTRAAPWEGLLLEAAGWWVDVDADALCGALDEAMYLPPAALGAMGERGRAWMKRDFGWEAIGRRWVDVYRWLLDGDTKPQCVVLPNERI